MNKPCIYEIRVKGVLADRWSDWFEGLEVHVEMNGETILRGEIIDQAALFSMLTRINNLNLTLISVVRSSPE
jgi:hypothetical protein